MNSAISDSQNVHGGRSLYLRFGKRVFDVLLSAAGLLVLSPVIASCALLVKMSSPGPVVFSQTRVGLNRQTFKLYKFRSMYTDRNGVGITVSGDPRVTAIGRHLRRTKLDEILQLWNVLKGDMSLVGPRPEIPSYVAKYNDRQKSVLSVRPGITDYASILYRNEEELLASSEDPQRFYEEVVMPHKVDLGLLYVSNASLRTDLKLILQTLSIVPPGRKSAEGSV
ncbi:MAG TPA: sugar transferase [Terriglobales bacterium]|nr:sugar transferase [Terriglobales bacterium]